MTLLPVTLACKLAPRPVEHRFLVENLWSEGAVGIVGGEPKCFKSFLALDLALAVASGRPALRRFEVNRPGPVLFFAAEDALHVVRERLDGIAAASEVVLEGLPIHVVIAPSVRLDVERDCAALRATVAALRPRLLVLDPFIRLHRRNENAADEVAPLLAFLRDLQRTLDVSVLLVHHARKGGHARGGQALRGSSELHAWGDSNLYLRRCGERLALSIEHRAAADLPPLELELRADPGLALAVVGSPQSSTPERPRPASERVVEVLTAATGPMTRREIRAASHMRSAAVGESLAELLRCDRIVRDDRGFRLREGVSSTLFPEPH
jgi:hypothetical protein